MIGVFEVELGVAIGALKYGLVFVDRLENSVMRQPAIGEREPPGAGDPLTRLLALDYLGAKQEFLLLLLAELRFRARVVVGDEKGCRRQAEQRQRGQCQRSERTGKHDPPPCLTWMS